MNFENQIHLTILQYHIHWLILLQLVLWTCFVGVSLDVLQTLGMMKNRMFTLKFVRIGLNSQIICALRIDDLKFEFFALN